jgi:UPF0716 protein FxsA
MGLILLLLFLATPIAEIAVFIEAGDRFGLWPTILAVVATAVLGAALLRWQGLSTLARASKSLQRNEIPMAEIFTGLCLVAAGALLLTPGFITDTIGFALFVPPLRNFLFKGLRRFLEARGAVWMDSARGAGGGAHANPFNPDGEIIDGDFHETETSTDPAWEILPPPQNIPQNKRDGRRSPWSPDGTRGKEDPRKPNDDSA